MNEIILSVGDTFDMDENHWLLWCSLRGLYSARPQGTSPRHGLHPAFEDGAVFRIRGEAASFSIHSRRSGPPVIIWS